MKKVVRSIAVVAFMFVVSTGLAKEPKLSLTPNAEKSLSFELNKASDQTFVSIVDANGAIIYTQTIAKGDIFSKKFDLRNLPEGYYFLEVEDTLKETVFEFIIADSRVKITEKKENAKPIFRKNEGRVFLNLLNLEKEIVKIKVYDADNRIVFEETLTNEPLIEKVFNFKKAFENTYTLVVKNKNDVYYETISVK